jgi:hypothetical protein
MLVTQMISAIVWVSKIHISPQGSQTISVNIR